MKKLLLLLVLVGALASCDNTNWEAKGEARAIFLTDSITAVYDAGEMKLNAEKPLSKYGKALWSLKKHEAIVKAHKTDKKLMFIESKMK